MARLCERKTNADTEHQVVVCLVSCVMAVIRPAWRPREHTWAHGPVQELLVEQDAVDVLHCGSTQNDCLDQKNGDESAVSIIVFHTSSVLVTVREPMSQSRAMKRPLEQTAGVEANESW